MSLDIRFYTRDYKTLVYNCFLDTKVTNKEMYCFNKIFKFLCVIYCISLATLRMLFIFFISFVHVKVIFWDFDVFGLFHC